MLDLILPLECGGCGAPSTKWCDVCASTLNVHTDEPHLVTPRIDPPGVPVFALGRYVGPRRQAIVALKEHGRRDLVAPFARALALGIHQLETWGILDIPFTIVPAPPAPWPLVAAAEIPSCASRHKPSGKTVTSASSGP